MPSDPPYAAAALARAAVLANRFLAVAAHHDSSGECPLDLLDAVFDAGLLAVPVARAAGGCGGGLALAGQIVSEIARGEPATALIVAMHYANHAAIARGAIWPAALGDRVARESLGRRMLINAAQVEPGIGSPSHGGIPETIARAGGERGETWRLSGTKRYCTGAPALAWIIVSATTDEADRRIGTFLVPADAPGVRIVRRWNATGMRATASDDIVLDDVVIPRDHLIGVRPADAPLVRDEIGSAWHFCLVAAVYHGIARSARDWLVQFAQGLHLATVGATLAEQPFFRSALGEIEVRLETSARVLRSVAEDVDNGVPVGPGGPIARHIVTDNAIAVTQIALEVAGAAGLSRDHPLERHHRDALCARAHAPNNGLIRGMAADRALRRRVE